MVRTKIGFGLLAGLLLSSAESRPAANHRANAAIQAAACNINSAIRPRPRSQRQGRTGKGPEARQRQERQRLGAQGRAGPFVRRFFDSDGDNQIDVWSYFLDGDEVYREVDSNLQRQGRSVSLARRQRLEVGVDVERGRPDRFAGR